MTLIAPYTWFEVNGIRNSKAWVGLARWFSGSECLVYKHEHLSSNPHNSYKKSQGWLNVLEIQGNKVMHDIVFWAHTCMYLLTLGCTYFTVTHTYQKQNKQNRTLKHWALAQDRKWAQHLSDITSLPSQQRVWFLYGFIILFYIQGNWGLVGVCVSEIKQNLGVLRNFIII